MKSYIQKLLVTNKCMFQVFANRNNCLPVNIIQYDPKFK